MKDSQSAKIKSNYLSLFKTEGGMHLYKKIQEFEQSCYQRAIVAKTNDEKLQALAEATAFIRLKSYIDIATNNKLKSWQTV